MGTNERIEGLTLGLGHPFFRENLLTKTQSMSLGENVRTYQFSMTLNTILPHTLSHKDLGILVE